jgi:hypothetical protein
VETSAAIKIAVYTVAALKNAMSLLWRLNHSSNLLTLPTITTELPKFL